MHMNMNKKIEFWKKNLLDLGKRNRLINYKDTKNSTLCINEPGMFEIWDYFVEKEKTITFPFCSDAVDDDNPNLIAGIEKSPIRTDKKRFADLQNTLANLRSKAKSVLEEQGINTLYLAFGFLKWTEGSFNKQELVSPLILVPVKISLDSVMSPYVMNMTDDEIVVNPALNYKFSKEFGFELPNFDENIEVQTFFEQVKELAQKKKWELIEDTKLGLFSFLKINMYNDLERNREKISEHPVVRAICGEKTAVPDIPSELNDICFDSDSRITPNDCFQVVDSDSSQQKAILCANKGLSFILQGPPGTGKSQTITNIIAESLGRGKKVLFVSEKMAALDVVYKRLSAANLSDFCLVLHSLKANKQAVLDQLDASLQLASKKVSLSEKVSLELENLYQDKLKLNKYAKDLHTVIKPLNKSIFEVNGLIASLELYKDVTFNVQNIRDFSEEKLNKLRTSLGDFKNTLGLQTIEPGNNPWRNSSLKSISNEERHNITVNVTAFSDLLKNLLNDFDDFNSKSHLKIKLDFGRLREFIDFLDFVKSKPAIPFCWFGKYELSDLESEIEEILEKDGTVKVLIEKIKGNYNLIPEGEKKIFALGNETDFNNSNLIEKRERNINSEINGDEVLNKICNGENEISSSTTFAVNVKKLADLLKENVSESNSIKERILSNFENDIFNLDYKPILVRIKTDYSSLLGSLNKNFGNDKKTIKAYAKDINLKISKKLFFETICDLNRLDEIKNIIETKCNPLKDIFGKQIYSESPDFEFINDKVETSLLLEDILRDLNSLKEIISSLEKSEPVFSQHYEQLYKGVNTDWENIKACMAWAGKYNETEDRLSINKEFTEYMCNSSDFENTCSALAESINNFLSESEESYKYYSSLFYLDEIEKSEIYELQKRATYCAADISLLEQWIDFKASIKNCEKDGLGDFIQQVIDLKISKDDIIPCFEKRFYKLWLDSVLDEYPAIRDFRTYKQEELIAEFAKLDKEQCNIAQARIRAKLIDALPLIDSFSSSMDEIGILKREIKKQRRRMPIRKLFKSIPNLIITLKPCLMMSPLSVSLFLESDFYQFDIVIFDEASQVKTEDAIGAISRGKQVIIAGDSKQLPPTNFFNSSSSDSSDNDIDEDDEIENSDLNSEVGNNSTDYESIIDEANCLPEETLKWHYRSRDEQLIAFSNAKIYKNELITFPSNKAGNVKDYGVEYIYVKDGFYDRGGSRGNVPEAEKVANLIFEHIKKFPERSLGVITFGEKQQHAIESVVISRRKKNPEYEDFFSEEAGEEPFFIKNLENVQGDERDTIIFSIGYGKDSNGVFRMNFGPLSKKGGERRLNVAVTRAKYNIKLVGSIQPADIDLEKVSSEGPALLKSYIEFAQHGVSALGIEEQNENESFASPFEKAVYDFIKSKGYDVVSQVGCSGYRVDIGVKHPENKDVFVLGIQCDGRSYFSSKTARDRDRLRQDVLEKMGWNIYRVWSTDWAKSPETEEKRLIAAIEEAVQNYGKAKKTENKEQLKEASDFFQIEDKVSSDNESNIYGFRLEDLTDKNLLPKNLFAEVNSSDEMCSYLLRHKVTYKKALLEVIRKSNTISFELLCIQVVNNSSLEPKRPTHEIRRTVYKVLEDEFKSYEIIGDDNFVYFQQGEKYVTHYNNKRKTEFIPVQEISNAMFIILSKKVGLTKENLIEEVSKAYNFKRMTQVKEDYFNDAFEALISDGKIKIEDEKIKIIN